MASGIDLQSTNDGNWSRLRRRLTRVTSSGRFIPEIDGVRFIAIAFVVLAHINDFVSFRTGFPLDAYHQVQAGEQRNWFTYFIAHGAVGVPLFFVISGFVLGVPFAASPMLGRPKVNLSYYFVRRLTRLEPPYLLALGISFLLLIVFYRRGNPFQEFSSSVLLSSVYLHNLAMGGPPFVNAAYWSLEVEVQFYLLAPLLARVFGIANRLPRRAILIGMILILGAIQPLLPWGARVPLSILGQAHYFLAGFLLADIYTADWREHPPTFGWRSLLITLIGWPLLFVLLNERFDSVRHAILPLLIVSLYIPILAHGPGTRWLASPLVTIIGGMCYSIYLLHFPVIFGVGRLAERFGPIAGSYSITFLLYSIPIILAVLAVAIAFFVAVERPCMDRRWPQQVINRLRRPFADPALAREGSV